LELQAWCIGQLYDAGLDDMIARVEQIKRDNRWKELRAWKPKTSKEKKQRTQAYSVLYEEYKLSEYDTINRVRHHCKASKWIADHVDGKMVMALGGEIWNNIANWIYAKHGEPHYKPSGDRKTLAGIDTKSGLRYIPGKRNQPGRVVQRTLGMRSLKRPLSKKSLNARTDWSLMSKGRSKYYLAQQDKIRQTKLVLEPLEDALERKGPRGVVAHLTFDCLPYRSQEYLDEVSNAQPTDILSMDYGPSQAAYVTTDGVKGIMAPSAKLRAEKAAYTNKIKKIDQAMDRSKREMNPDCYEQNGKGKHTQGKSIRGKRHKLTSKRQKSRARERRRLYAQETKLLNQYHRAKIRELVLLACNLVTEYDRFDEWCQNGYGKSIQSYAMGRFKDLLLREFAILGGWTHEHDPYVTKLSSTCLCGTRCKKDIRTRVHVCQNKECPLFEKVLHRDLFSAYLGLLVKQYGIGKLMNGSLQTEHWKIAVDMCATGSEVTPEKSSTSGVGPVTGTDALTGSPGTGREDCKDRSSQPQKITRRGLSPTKDTTRESVPRLESSDQTIDGFRKAHMVDHTMTAQHEYSSQDRYKRFETRF
jgi:hypothetical protein